MKEINIGQAARVEDCNRIEPKESFLRRTTIQILPEEEYQKVCVIWYPPEMKFPPKDYSRAFGFLIPRIGEKGIFGGTITINKGRFGEGSGQIPKKFLWSTVLHELAELNFICVSFLQHPRFSPQIIDPSELYKNVPSCLPAHLTAIVIEYEEAQRRRLLEELHRVKMRALKELHQSVDGARETVFDALRNFN